MVTVGVGRNNRTVHLFWVHSEGCVDRLKVQREEERESRTPPKALSTDNGL